MPTCKKCNIYFKNRITIDGKEHSIAGRKYCLVCSPFGGNNRLKLESEVLQQGLVHKCVDCGKEYIYQRNAGLTTKHCNSCLTTLRHRELKIKGVGYLGGKCCICGYNKCLASMDFHHIDETQKKFTIGSSFNRSWLKIKNELDKCVVLCRNCHGEYHAGLISKEQIREARNLVTAPVLQTGLVEFDPLASHMPL